MGPGDKVQRRLRRLLLSEGRHWIGAHRSARRKIAGEEANSTEQQHDGAEGYGVHGADAEQYTTNSLCGTECDETADAQPDRGDPDSLSYDQSVNRTSFGAESDAYPDLASALRDGVGDDAE